MRSWRAMLPRMRSRYAIFAILVMMLPGVSRVGARVTRVEVTSREDVLGGKLFDDGGAYQRIAGRVYFSLAVGNAHNAAIVDLKYAENLKNREVEVSADFIAVRPKDQKKSNGTMILEVPNRGRSRIIALVDGGDW